MKTKIIFSSISLIIGITVGTFVIISSSASVPNEESGVIKPVYSMNDNGLSYGTVENALSTRDEPDLILVYGDNGNLGYVYKNDLNEEPPKSPEEAEKRQIERIKNKEFSRVITVYENDGETIIDTFTAIGNHYKAFIAGVHKNRFGISFFFT